MAAVRADSDFSVGHGLSVGSQQAAANGGAFGDGYGLAVRPSGQVKDLGRHAARADVQGHLHRRLAVGDFELTLLVADDHEVNPLDGTEFPAEPARAAIRHAGLLDDSGSDRVTASIN